jgi:hypothetical protein
MGRRPTFTRTQRIERGLPVCRTEECDRAPWKRDYCSACRSELDLPRRQPGPKSELLPTPGSGNALFCFRVDPQALVQLRERARGDGVSAGEWVRRAISAALRGQT